LRAKGAGVNQAIACFHRALALDPHLPQTHNNLGLALQAKGQMDEAIACFRKAIDIDPKLAGAHNNLGNALWAGGKVDEAIACYHKAIALDPDIAQAHAALGRALLARGDFLDARQALHRCLALFPADHPDRALVLPLLRLCRQGLTTGSKLKAFLAGKGAPADPAIQVEMAIVAQLPANQLYLTAVRLYRDAFARQPGLADAHRYHAACAAVRCGTRQGKDAANLDSTTRAEMRYLALSWLQDDLSAQARQLAGSPPDTEQSRKTLLLHAKPNPALAFVRDPAALAQLPEAEQVAWLNLWAQVDALLAR
jgi:tetratricopeptide (TPR) repeat protein